MKKIAASFAVLGLMTASTLAQGTGGFDIAAFDTDGDGQLSYVELVVAWPDLTQSEFDAADIDGSGTLSADELLSLQPGTGFDSDVLEDDSLSTTEPSDPAESLSN